MAVLYVPHFIQFFDNNGDPLSGGKLYTYTAGTVTPKQTFTNQGGATPNANPLILDSAGRGVMFLDGSYKFRLEDSLGNLIRETDNVTAFSVQSSTVDNIIANFPEDVVVAADSFIFADASDSNTTKRDTIQGLIDLVTTSTVGGFKNRVLNGLTLSNNTTDPTNDIDIAAGSCVSDDGTTVMTISAITKRLDAAWAVGTNQGGLDTGAIANTTYHIWVISRVDTGVVDVLFSASATSPTMPANYTKKKCIGSIIRASAAILLFNQYGRDFILSTPVLDVNNAPGGTAAITATLASVPSGVKVKALINALTAANGTYIYVSSLDSADLAPSTTAAPLSMFGQSAATNTTSSLQVWTSTSQTIRYRVSATDTVRIATLGWIDPRV